MFLSFGTTPHSQSDSAEPGAQAAPSRPRAKRTQVAQACDGCRAHRTKCDNSRPCQNCVLRGVTCGVTRSREVRTFPHAFREIQRLTARVRELELELAQHNGSSANSSTNSVSTGSSGSTTSSETTTPLSDVTGSSRRRTEGKELGPFAADTNSNPSKRLWEGIYASTTQSSPKQWYGPSSLFYFIGRMEKYMTRALQQPSTDRTIWFKNSASKGSLPSPSASSPDQEVLGSTGEAHNRRGGQRQNQTPRGARTPGEYLNASQEEYFLGLFWQSHHCSLQIVDEAAFREHYRSLCLDPPPGCFRKPSALVDIMVALCMQYGMAFLPRREPAQADGEEGDDAGADDGTLAGWWHYQRCRIMLESEMERPTLSTLQCLVFSVIYLCCASFQNTAHHLLALAVRIACTLGLHLEPPPDMPRPEGELRKRLWWTIYITEAKTCMKFGRPWSTAEAQMSCTLPADDHALALQSGCSNTASIIVDGTTVTWLTYTLQDAKLVLAARDVYVPFYDRCAEILGSTETGSLYDDAAALETVAADALQRCMDGPRGLRAWLRDVPGAMKTQRVRRGLPFSTDLSRLDIEMFAPAWLQRQRLFLELLYHTLMINLHRPFIAFPAVSESVSSSSAPTPGPLATAHATTAARHCIAITAILHQILTETDLLRGWHEAFQQQWNAAITMVGFLLAFPASPAASGVRAALADAVRVFEEFGKHFAVGTSAAHATRDLLSKANSVLLGADNGIGGEQQQQFRGMDGTGPGQSAAAFGQRLSLTVDVIGAHEQCQTAPSLPARVDESDGPQPAPFMATGISDDEVAAAVRGMLAGTMDMLYSADSFQAMTSGPFSGGAQTGLDGWPPGLYYQ